MIGLARERGLQRAAKKAARAAGSEANKGFAFVERNWYLTKRYWAWELVWITYNVINALSVTFIAPSAQSTSGATFSDAQVNQFILYLAIGTAVWTFLSVVFDGVTETVTMERWEGTIEYTFMSPVSRVTHMFGACAYALIHGIIMTALQLGVMALFFHLDLSHANWWIALLVLAIGSFSFIGFGTVAAVLPMLYTERGAQMAYIIRAVILLVSGVYYPVTVLPPFLQALSVVSPATYVLDGLRGALLPQPTPYNAWPVIWPLILCAIISIPVGQYIFHLAERYAKRTGKLKRNG
ncbi:MAG TPA: ABC transporter permease [Ktedonobacterales bacterium]|nr:ABC transporter permease [Ktedonobacterales bacterium]